MPVHVYSLSLLDNLGAAAETALFQDLIGTVVHSSQRMEMIARRGVDYTGLRSTGDRALVTTLSGVLYYQSFADADTGIKQLIGWKGAEFGVKLIKESIDYGTFDLIEAQESITRALGMTVGSLIADANVEQRVVLQLLERPPVPAP